MLTCRRRSTARAAAVQIRQRRAAGRELEADEADRAQAGYWRGFQADRQAAVWQRGSSPEAEAEADQELEAGW